MWHMAGAMNEFVIHPLPVVESREPLALPVDSGFIDETVVRQMILDGNPDNRTGNPTLPAQNSREAFHRHPLAFAG